MEGELTLTKTLIVEPSGVVKANVTVKNAMVSGVVVGNIQATESVELTHEGRMVGDIRAPRVIIVDGASFRGRVDMGELPPGRSLPERARPGPSCGPPSGACLPRRPVPRRRAQAPLGRATSPRVARRPEAGRHAGHRAQRGGPHPACASRTAGHGGRREEEGRAEEEEVTGGHVPAGALPAVACTDGRWRGTSPTR